MRNFRILLAAQLMLLAVLGTNIITTSAEGSKKGDHIVSLIKTNARVQRYAPYGYGAGGYGYATADGGYGLAQPAQGYMAVPSAGGDPYYSGQDRSNYYEHRLGALSTPAVSGTGPRIAGDYLAYVTAEGTYQWPKERLPIRIYIAPGTGVPGYRASFRGIVESSFDAWVHATDGRLAWQEVADRNSADISIDFTNQVTQRTEGTEAGHTSCLTRLNTATNHGVIVGAKMQLLTQLPDRQFSDDEMRKTTLHEAGHAYGIQGHSPNRDDIMFYAVSPTQQPALTDRDVATMQRLYASYPTRSDSEIALLRRSRYGMGG